MRAVDAGAADVLPILWLFKAPLMLPRESGNKFVNLWRPMLQSPSGGLIPISRPDHREQTREEKGGAGPHSSASS